MFENRIGIAANNPKTQNQNKHASCIKGFSAFNDNHKHFFFQSKICGSDYNRAAVDGVCQDCQQKAEFVLREYPHIAARHQSGFQGGLK